MPFVSRKQEAWAFATRQPFAKQWAAMTDQSSLPVRKGKSVSNFDKLASKLAQRPGVSNPRGLAAAIGRKKYGASTMAKASARGIPAASVARKR
jgi:hypothetical protein